MTGPTIFLQTANRPHIAEERDVGSDMLPRIIFPNLKILNITTALSGHDHGSDAEGVRRAVKLIELQCFERTILKMCAKLDNLYPSADRFRAFFDRILVYRPTRNGLNGASKRLPILGVGGVHRN